MLQVIRDNMQSFFAWVIIGFLVLLMAMFGVDAFFTAPTSKGVIEVNGESISQAELQQEVYRQQQRLRSMMGDNVNPAMLDEEVLREPALESLVQRRVLMGYAEDQNITASQAVLMSMITANESFFVDGKFSQQRYESLLAQNGYNHARYLGELRSDMVMRQMIDGIASSSFVTETQVKKQAALLNEKRSGEYIRFPLASRLSEVSVSDDEIETFFQQNKSRFMTEEELTVSYIHLRPEDFFAEVTDEQILEQYELELKDLDKRDEKRVAHILVESDSETAPEKILDIKKQLDAGSDFSELAKNESEDVASAMMGGELGVTRGDTFPEPFEQVLSTLKPEQVSDPVKTESGWHLVKLLSVTPFEVPDFASNRERIEYELQLAEAKSIFPAKVEELADISFNASDLQGPAEQLGLEVQTSGIFTRDDAARLGTPFNEPAVVRAAFSEDVLVDGNNSELVELEDGSAVVLRVVNHEKPRLKELATVRQEIETRLRQEKASELLKSEVADLVEKTSPGKPLAANDSLKSFTVETIEPVNRGQFMPDRKLVTGLFSSSPGQPPSIVELSNGDIAVYRLSKVLPGKLDEQQKLDERMEQMLAADDFSRFQQSIENDADIVRNEG